MNKKIFVIAAIGLLLLSSLMVLPVSSEDTINITSNSNTLYVDDDNTMGPWDGTNEHPYQHIQDAIDNASNSDKVFVHGGIYYEHIKINKSMDLIGENRENTIIDGNESGNIIHISDDFVNISAFTIRNSGGSYGQSKEQPGICIKHSNHITISNNIISNCYMGIYSLRSNNIKIMSNVINSNRGHGLWLSSSKDSVIKNNDIYKNKDIGLYLMNSENNDVNNNFLEDNKQGINLWSSSKNNISNNIIKLNNDHGIRFGDSNNNTFFNNNIVRNGLGMNYYGGKNNIISKNNFLFNKKDVTYSGGQVLWQKGDKFVIKVYKTDAKWDENYWNRPRFGPKLIMRPKYSPSGFWGGWIPPTFRIYLDFDFHPALKPYDIPGLGGDD